MTLTLYFVRRFLRDFFWVCVGVSLVMLLIDSIEQIRRFGQDGVGMVQIGLLAALNLPATINALLPLLSVLAGVAMFLGLARTSELVVVRASGRSALRMAFVPAVIAFLLGALALAALNPIAAATAKRYDQLASRIQRGDSPAASIGRDGVWLRQAGAGAGNAEVMRQSVIHAQRANADATELFDVTVMEYALDLGPIRYLQAAGATLEPGAWVLADVKEWPLADSPNPETEAVRHASLRLASDLTADRIRDSFGAPGDIAIWDLPDFIAALDRAGFSSRRHAAWLQKELAQPLMLAAMVLIAAAFTMRHARRGRTGLMALLAFGTGVVAMLLRNFAQAMGENGLLPVMLAAWAPPLVAILGALTLILFLEEG